MPRLIVGGQVQTGQSILDHGITDLLVHVTQAGAMLYTTSGPSGGIAGFAVGAQGALSLHDFTHFDPAIALSVMDQLTVLDTTSGPRLIVAGDPDAGLTALALDATGGIGGPSQLGGLVGVNTMVLDLDQMGANTLYLAKPGALSIQAYQIDTTSPDGALAQQFTIADTATTYGDSVFALTTMRVAGIDYLVGASVTEQGVSAYRISATGLTATGSLGMAEGIGMMTPTALATASLGGRCFALVASAPGDGLGQSGAITVMQLLSDGSLAPTDHVIDTHATRFGMVQSLDVITAGGFTYVLAGGGDDGITLFVLLPNGRLHLLDVLADQGGIGLENITSVAAMQIGNRVEVFVASQIGAGVTNLAFDTTGNGQMRMATASGGDLVGSALNDILIGGAGNDRIMGGDGADIIEDGAGSDTLAGGAGADRFILRADGLQDRITDFETGRDRLDLSGWPFLYDPAQLSIQSTIDGAIVTWRNEVLMIQTALGMPLSAAQLIASIITAPDRSPIQFTLPIDPRTPTEGADSITGTEGNDTLAGLGGNDTLIGGLGHDYLYGGADRDRLFGGADQDQLFGGADDDVLFGGPGNDTLDGGTQNDTLNGEGGDDHLAGGEGNDRLIGREGNDRLAGDAGHDHLFGGAGNDTLWGGMGRDTLDGEVGHDSLSGGAENDLLIGRNGNDTLLGEADRDRLFGGADQDQLFGGADDDVLFGGPGNDTLDGGTQNDMLNGEGGDDHLAGGEGNDRLIGGAGSDVFVFADGHGQDTVQDFAALDPSEKIDLSAITALAAVADYDALVLSGALSPTADGVLIDTGHGNSILLFGVTLAHLDNGDFIF
ncbi:hypothetical protein LSUCC0031_01160 [Rhodobacterales bacterium LSUCC0031]|nr:hypothetical protein [Rhodobacterales bacterium LSUCC0031]